MSAHFRLGDVTGGQESFADEPLVLGSSVAVGLGQETSCFRVLSLHFVRAVTTPDFN